MPLLLNGKPTSQKYSTITSPTITPLREATKSTLSEVLPEAVKRELARSTFHDRMAKCSSVDFGVSAASLFEEERHQSHQEREC